MYKILIVDDEKIERNGIKFLLKKSEVECEITEAVNGKEALELINKQEFDILLTDVRMPFMDGIELIENITKLNKDIKYIIFSGCNEFDYAKQAVKLGVSDYILKPVDPTEFDTTIHKVIAELDERRAEKDLKSKSIEYMNEHMLYLAANGSSIDEITEYNDNLIETDFLNNYKRIMLIEFNDDFYGKNGIDFKENIIDEISVISNYLNLNQQQSLVFFKDKVLNFVNIAERILGKIEAVYDQKCYVAISSEFEGYEGIAASVEELDRLMENKFYHPNSYIFYAGMSNDTDSIIQLDDDTLMKQMKQDLKMKDITSLRDHFERFCDKYRCKTSFSQVYIKFLFSNLLKDFYDCVGEIEGKTLNDEIEKLYASNQFDTVMKVVTDNIDILEKKFKPDIQMVHGEIEQVKKYISEHFNEEISVDGLSEMVYMSPSYLSTVFKKETGQNLSKYIKSYRMEKAREMLEDTSMKILDISNECGYPNVSYFCSSFREYFGISPQKFRESGE